MTNKQKIWITLSLTFLYIGIIFGLSIVPYEYQDIKPLLKENVELPEEILPEIEFYYDGDYVSTSRPYDFIEFLLRKTGHVIGYFGLTLLLFLGLGFLRMQAGLRYALSGIAALFCAALDEWNQSLTDGRTGHWQDIVVVDLLGVVLALCSVAMLKARRKNRKRQQRKRVS